MNIQTKLVAKESDELRKNIEDTSESLEPPIPIVSLITETDPNDR